MISPSSWIRAERSSIRQAQADEGYATVWAAGWMLVLGVVAWAAVLIAVAVARQHHLDGAADLAAVSGARALQRGQDGCAEAQRVAEANDVGVTTCEVVDQDVLVRVSDSFDLASLPLRIESRARAGPG